MKTAPLVLLVLAACATAPGPKTPDELHRVPVNRMAPPEATTDEPVDSRVPPARKDSAVVEWR